MLEQAPERLLVARGFLSRAPRSAGGEFFRTRTSPPEEMNPGIIGRFAPEVAYSWAQAGRA
jgi:hypothetical protein